jgi:hypothetical protein
LAASRKNRGKPARDPWSRSRTPDRVPHLDPAYLVFVFGVPSDQTRDALRENLPLKAKMKQLLVRFDWAAAARDRAIFEIESQEAVDRKSGGDGGSITNKPDPSEFSSNSACPFLTTSSGAMRIA